MKTNTETNRRDFLLAAGALTAIAAAPSALASSAAHHHHGSLNKGLVESSAHCTSTGNACIAHCLILLGDGDTEMAECAKSVQQMLSMCNAVGYHAAANSKYLKQMVGICRDICKDCEKACRKHEKKHAECKACAESCANMVAACNTYLKTA